MGKSVKIIYNDDGADEYILDGEKIVLEEISKTAHEIEDALKAEGFLTSVLPLKDNIDRSGLDEFIKELRGAGESVIFNLCEGALGYNMYEMHVAALLELYGLKFTGSGPFALALALDKGLTKAVLTSRNIRTPGYFVAEDTPETLEGGLSFPLIVKPLLEDASSGIDSGAVVGSMEELRERVDYVLNEFGQSAIVEEYIGGREFNIAVMGNWDEKRALPPAELSFVDFPAGVPRICSYEAKWVASSPLYKKTVPVCPANIDEPLREELEAVALEAYDAIGCRDYARVDVRMTDGGDISVLEVNPNPDISSDAGFARAALAEGLDYPGLLSEIVAIACERYEEEDG
ncbi:MAG: D-alanine--D-alanine ligase [Thermodesulfobacteriota bacterium]